MAEGKPTAAADDGAEKKTFKLPDGWWAIIAISAWCLLLVLAIAFFSGERRTHKAPDDHRESESAPKKDDGGEEPGSANGGAGVAQPTEGRDAGDSSFNTTEAATTLGEADRFQEYGEYEAALKGYETLQQQATGSLANLLDFRIGVCAERLGDHERALSSYRSVADSTDSPVLQDVSRIGLARVYSRQGSHDLAVSVLSDLRLSSESSEPQVTATAAHLLADSLARQVTSGLEVDPLDDASTYEHDSRDEVDLVQLAGDDASRAPKSQQTDFEPGLKPTLMAGKSPELVHLSGRLDRTAVQAVVDRMIREGGFEPDWSAAAQRTVLGRSQDLSIAPMSLAAALDLLVVPSGLFWTFDGTDVLIRTAEEIDSTELQSLRRDVAVRALTTAAYQYPDSPLAASSMLWLGNLAFLQRDYAAAGDYYEQLLRQFPRSPSSSDARFNLSKTHVVRGDDREALEGFYRVIDANVAGSHVQYAYLYAGRLLIESGDSRHAVSRLQRARAVADSPEVEANVAALLSAAHLLSDDPHQSNRVLMEHRDALKTRHDRRVAAMLSGLSRYRAEVRSRNRERAARSLLEALSHVQPTDFFGRYGWWLLGTAYRDLGFAGNATEVFEDGLAQSPPVPFRRQIQLELADLHRQNGDLGEATRILSELVIANESPWTADARRQLSLISLETGDLPASLAFARAALRESPDDAARTQVLQLMGRVYEHAGDHASAALCFSGAAPTTEIQTPKP